MTVNPMLPKHRLILLRHAKSAWPDGVADRERPLADRGRKAARVIGTYMVREKLIPDLALVSPARRAKETWKLVRGALSKKVSEREAADIYEVSAERILDVIRAVEPGIRTLLIVGHNPGMENAASLIVADGDADAVGRMQEKFPTAGLGVIDLDLDGWGEIAAGTGYLERFVTPRSLG
ncbi:SixA phosphatase family protein [Rhizobium ruizarguesonis]|uniref:SixA phosphatase family protein n=1 Tax=Rhizobium ruizarguesonis TaxID=2081791 RepID=UPI0009498224|nr:histidine phosphatase family protein [Rhizobium ruizarguesonis]NKL44566.1 histidine phosphatase family protein [Rhizobium leguminosarum bv. viciae]NKQ88174.1 histidine phosphatase family protein [Rhizobium ruizarguesonis]QND21154.1 histidine phosphatase family protein [Rhizobium leguminosarum bv. viciae]TAU47230.1 histidine phosphatase family protein [Rhizobium ruizarguesonis]TAU62303.1 histidine phosphatase family protein [Rhizobium ruizarguesonis]